MPGGMFKGMLYDLAALKKEMGEVLALVDHKHLDKDVPYFLQVIRFSIKVY